MRDAEEGEAFVAAIEIEDIHERAPTVRAAFAARLADADSMVSAA